jgi:hypothetical protein
MEEAMLCEETYLELPNDLCYLVGVRLHISGDGVVVKQTGRQRVVIVRDDAGVVLPAQKTQNAIGVRAPAPNITTQFLHM